jgi:PKD repeat protein
MRLVTLDKANRIQKINQFLNCGPLTRNQTLLPFECNSPMDMEFGSDGALYTMTYGTGFFTINPASGLFRFSYVKGGRPPVAVASADKTEGPTPLTVKFSSAGSNTPAANESITYSWNFGDGSARSLDPNPTHTYTNAGVYTAILTVTDSSGKQSTTSIRIVAGNTAPTVVVNTPVEGGTFTFGNSIPFTVTVTDPEDGAAIDCSRVTVTFVLGHDTHGHAEQSVTGCSGTLVTDASDLFHGGNVFGVINASYTDKGGAGGTPPLASTSIHNIRQKHQEVENVVTQSGTNTGGNTDGGLTPPGTNGVHRGSLAAGDWIQLPGPFNLTNINSITFRVADAVAGRTAGSPLARIEIHQDSITGPVLANADLVSTGSTTTWTSQSYNLTMSGTHEIFLVFREVTGGATGTTLFNLNWAQFNGAGIGT